MGLGAIGTGGSNWAKKGSVPDIPPDIPEIIVSHLWGAVQHCHRYPLLLPLPKSSVHGTSRNFTSLTSSEGKKINVTRQNAREERAKISSKIGAEGAKFTDREGKKL